MSCRASDALPHTWITPSPGRSLSSAIAPIVLRPPSSVVLFHRDGASPAGSVRDTTYLATAFIWSAKGSPARPGHAAAITSQVRRPNSNAEYDAR
jgi:hypothetical protein